MTRRLIYVVGPSGAGKDSVLHRLREIWVDMPSAYWTRRTITRPAQAGGEANECVSECEFERLRQAGAFAMDWQANGLCYGIRLPELAPLSTGHSVFVNGSRAYLPQVLQRWPQATVVQITARTELLLQRLRARNRESVQAISDRLARGVDLALPDDAICIINEGPIADAVEMLSSALRIRLETADETTR